MTNDHTHVSSLVSDLVQMAQATARLPELEAELRKAEKAIADLISRNEALERKIESEVSINTELAAKLHAAEVARDDAGFRQLEAEDRAAALRNAIENVFPALAKTLAALDSDGNDVVMRTNTTELHEFQTYRDKQAEDARKAAEEAKQMKEAQLAGWDPAKPMDPISATADTVTSITPGLEVGNTTSGQREPDPTGASSGAMPSPSAEPSAPSSTSTYGGVSVSSDPTASQPTSPSETVPGTIASPPDGARTGKYSDHRYADWPYYVSEAGWIEGGGTHESYWAGRADWASPSPKTA